MVGRGSVRARLAAGSIGLVLVAAPAAAPVTSIAAAETASWNHDPASSMGPTHWRTLNPAWRACASAEGQSPIAIKATRREHLPALRVDYARTPVVVENTGHVVEVPQPANGGGTLLVGDHRYRLVQWHVHAPSEHVIHGHRDLEIHLVHQDQQGQAAVLAVFADIVSPPEAAPRTPAANLLRTTLQAAPNTAGKETDVAQKASAAVLLAAAVGRLDQVRVIPRYLTYTGSLTTPPCTGGVRWFLLPRTIGVDRASVRRLHALVAFPRLPRLPGQQPPGPAGRVTRRRAPSRPVRIQTVK